MREIDEHTIIDTASIYEAIEKININGKRFIAVIDKNIKIYDATIGGKLEVFPKINHQSLFKKK